MGIQTFLKKRSQKKGLERAVKTGEESRQRGDTIISTTQGSRISRATGGGSGSSILDIVPSSSIQKEQERIAGQKIQDQLKVKKIEEADQREEQRQEKIRSQTIAGQIESKNQILLDVQPGKKQGKIQTFISEKETKGARGDLNIAERGSLFGASLVLSVAQVPIRTFQFGKSLITKPVQTITSIPSGLIASGKQISSELQGRTPETALGKIGAEVLVFKGLSTAPKVLLKGSDIVRTRGLKELPASQIIAPEFFAGQTFPKIKKGQTAGELLTEFKPLLPGETKAGGFTATPKPFSKITEAQRGTSEFPGVFQSPKVSPRFLRVGGEGETKLFSLNVFDTPRPSIVRITPESFQLVPKVKATQKFLSQDIKQTKQFFETAPKDKSFIPFIKTEKESVIPFGTKLIQQDKRFFVKFEGRRIPIFEFKTAGGEASNIGKIQTIKDISKSFSSRKIGSTGSVTPLTSLSFIPSRSGIKQPSRTKEPFVSKGIGSKPPLRPSIPSTTPKGLTSPSSSRGTSSFDKANFFSLPRSFAPETDLFQPKKKQIIRGSAERKPVKKKTKQRRKFLGLIRPSFTGIILEIEAPAKVSKTLGVVPGQIRGKLQGFTPAKKSRSSKKLTNL